MGSVVMLSKPHECIGSLEDELPILQAVTLATSVEILIVPVADEAQAREHLGIRRYTTEGVEEGGHVGSWGSGPAMRSVLRVTTYGRTFFTSLFFMCFKSHLAT